MQERLTHLQWLLPPGGTFHEGSHLFNKYLLSVFSKHNMQLIRYREYIHNKRGPHLAHWFEEQFGKNGFESEEGYVDSREEKPGLYVGSYSKQTPR